MNGDWRRLTAGARIPAQRPDLRAVQARWLLACVRRNAACAFGRAHAFERIQSVKDFRQRVPVADYRDFAPLIERMAEGEADVLFCGLPLAFERTSGSSGAARLLPYSAASLADFSRPLRAWLATLARRYCFTEQAYWAISPALRQMEQTPGGVPVGLPDAAYLGPDLLSAFAALSAVPAAVGGLGDLAEWQRQTWLALLRCRRLELISIWSPTFLLALLDALPGHAAALAAELAGETAALGRLEGYLAERDGRRLWPHLRLVSCWADGASRVWHDELRRRLPQADFQPKGLLATEGIVTVPDADDAPVLAAKSGFFEFIGDDGAIRLAHELDEGADYDVLLTTAGGLYRYRLGDRVRCRGWAEGWPVLDFLGRAGLCSDLVGEKLCEAFVASCLPHDSGFCMLIAQPAPLPHYLLITDAAAPPPDTAAIEQRLLHNPHYRYARELGQLRALRAMPARRPLAAYVRRMTQQGMRLGDIKPVALRPETDWFATFFEDATR
ncbi:MAG: GH3 auxin-responsive promoter family protein [Azonexus sp.]|jgi:hypothetical protein|nr:GH3 auxin-responsive promoter family protein [Azonexus sp.]